MTEEYLVEKNKKIKQTIGNGLAGIVGFGSLALAGATIVPALSESADRVAERGYSGGAIGLLMVGTVITVPLFVVGFLCSAVAIYNTIQMIRKDFSYIPIDYLGD